MLLNSGFDLSNERDICGYNCAVINMYSNDDKVK